MFDGLQAVQRVVVVFVLVLPALELKLRPEAGQRAAELVGPSHKLEKKGVRVFNPFARSNKRGKSTCFSKVTHTLFDAIFLT